MLNNESTVSTDNVPPDEIYVRKDRVISVSDEFFAPFELVRDHYKYSWEEVFRRFLMYGPGIEYIFNGPDAFSGNIQLDTSTVMNLMPMWIENIRQNWNHLKFTTNDIPLHKGKPAIVVSAGPSAKKHGHIKSLAESNFQENGGIVIAGSHSLLPCLENRVIPNYVSNVDGSVRILKYLNDPLIIKHIPEIPLVLSASSDHRVVKFWADNGGKMYFHRSPLPDEILPNVNIILASLLPQLPELGSGGNSGSFANNLGFLLNCSPVCAIGFDLSNEVDVPIRSTYYWHRFIENLGQDGVDTVAKLEDFAYTTYHHTVFDTDCYYDNVFKIYRESFLEAAKALLEHPHMKFINASEEGCVEGLGIECMKFADFLADFA